MEKEVYFGEIKEHHDFIRHLRSNSLKPERIRYYSCNYPFKGTVELYSLTSALMELKIIDGEMERYSGGMIIPTHITLIGDEPAVGEVEKIIKKWETDKTSVLLKTK